MRLFAALPLPPDAHQAAADCLRILRQEGWPVRWVREEGLHLSLKFFGEVGSSRLDTISEMLGFCVDQMRPMTLAVRGAGVLPFPTRPRVILLDVDGPPDLELLQDRIERGGEGIGFAPEGRTFHPHITLGRVREGQRLPADALESLGRIRPQSPFVADRVVLFESELTPRGPRYQPRAEFVLR